MLFHYLLYWFPALFLVFFGLALRKKYLLHMSLKQGANLQFIACLQWHEANKKLVKKMIIKNVFWVYTIIYWAVMVIVHTPTYTKCVASIHP